MPDIPLFKVWNNYDVAEEIRLTLNSGYVGQGPKVEAFEEKLAKLWKLPKLKVATVNSCTSALHLALRLADVRPGDKVICTPMTCSATAWPILAAGADIVWADIDPQTGNISVEDVDKKSQKLDSRLKAVIAVDWGGRPCDLNQLASICRHRSMKLIVDAAHSILTWHNGKHAAEYADYVCHSFQAIKTLNTGDGGAIVCKDKNDAERARLLRWFGIDRNKPATKGDLRCEDDIVEYGYKFHMNDIAATIGLCNIPQVDALVNTHLQNACYYDRCFGTKNASIHGSNWLYTLLVPKHKRDPLMQHLKEKGIMSSKVHSRLDKHSVAKDYITFLPGVDEFYDSELCIPVGWWVGLGDREYIAKTVSEFLGL